MNLFNKLKWIVLLINFGIFAQQTSPQDSLQVARDTNALDEVVLIDSRFPFKQSQSGKPVVTISSETLKNFQGLGLSALIKQYAGIEILGSQTYAGQNKTISLRGGRNHQVLVLIDGIRISDPSRIDNDFNLNFLDLDQIESIEILKGASATLYGSSAATGVINIKTKTAAQGFQATLQSTTGSQNSQDTTRKFNLFKNSLHLSQGGEQLRAKAYLAHHSATGMSAVVGPETDPFDQLNIGASVEFKLKNAFDLKTGYDHSNIQSEYDNSFPLEDAEFKLATQMDRLHFNPNLNYKNGGLSLRLGYQKILRDFQSSFPFQTVAENTQAELFNKYVFGDRFYTVIGGLIQKNYAYYEGGQSTNQTDLFGNFVTKISEQFRINFGGRWNSHSNYGTHFTYSFNPSLQIFEKGNDGLKLQAAFSTAFIAPSLYQLYDPYSGNLDLKPEENRSFETGLVIKFKKAELVATYFNRIESPSLIYDLATYRYENTNTEARYFGAEFSFNATLGARLLIDQQLTFTETEEGDLRYLPNVSSQTRLTYNFSQGWSADLSSQLIGKRLGLDNVTVLDQYQLINFSITRELKNLPIRFFLHFTNLFNVDYIEIEGYATRGRNLLGGLRYRIL